MDSEKRAKAVSDEELLHCVGLWSNKKKADVMKKEKLTNKEYDKKRKFLFNVFNILSSERK